MGKRFSEDPPQKIDGGFAMLLSGYFHILPNQKKESSLQIEWVRLWGDSFSKVHKKQIKLHKIYYKIH